MVERQTPNLKVGGSSPSWPATNLDYWSLWYASVYWGSCSMIRMFSFFREVRQELAKVVWPNFNEFVGSTIVVLIIMAFFAVYLGAVDFGLRIIIEYILSL